jgi:cysteine desulfurase
MDRVYLDNAATTALRAEALEAMLPYFQTSYANASSLHSSGQRVRHALEQARDRTAAALGARPEEIVFTGSGSEADNLAIFGVMRRGGARTEFITCASEHHAVLHAADALRTRGHRVTIVPVDREGFVDLPALRAALSERTALVSLMHANNEIGTIQPIAQVAELVHAHGALFHTDAVQSVGHVPLNVAALGVDALSFSAHKFEGPKGVGGLFVRKGVALEPLIFGGGQEDGRRSGTENVPGIVGLSVALELAARELGQTVPALTALRDELIEQILREIPDSALNGPARERLPNNVNVRFEGIEGDTLVVGLDLAGIDVSTGSACSSGSLDPSHVMTAIGLPPGQARGCLRLSLGRSTTAEQLRRTVASLVPLVARLRTLTGTLLPDVGVRAT